MATPVNSISGTVCSGIADMNKYMSPVKAHNIIFGRAEHVHSTERMRWGNINEPAIADQALHKRDGEGGLLMHYGRDIGLLNITERLQHPEIGWYTGTPDYLILDEDDSVIGVLECKNTSYLCRGDWGDPEKDADPLIPKRHDCQVEWYRHLMQKLHNKDHIDAWIAVLIDGGDHRLFKREPPLEFHANLLKTCEDFWNTYVLTDTLPAIDGSKGTTKALSEYFPTAKNESLLASNEELESMAAERKEMKANVKEIEARIRTIDNKMRHAIGDNLGVEGSNWTAKWSDSSRTNVDTKALRAAHPALVKQFESKTEFRTLRVHYKKEA